MKQAKNRCAKGSFGFEILENRRMMYAAGMPTLVGLTGSVTGGVWNGFTTGFIHKNNADLDGGGNVAAAWKSGFLTVAYTKNDLTKLNIDDIVN